MIDFENEPLTDFSVDANREKYSKALNDVKDLLGRPYALWINGKARTTETSIVSVNPAERNQVIGQVAQGTVAEVEMAEGTATGARSRGSVPPPYWRTRKWCSSCRAIRRRARSADR